MTPAELRAAQEKLGLSQTQLARVLGIDPRSYRRLIAGQREVSGPIRRVVEALLEGWRPADWPAGKTRQRKLAKEARRK